LNFFLDVMNESSGGRKGEANGRMKRKKERNGGRGIG
jgi:hypothetical protein